MNEEDGDLSNWNYFVSTFDSDESFICQSHSASETSPSSAFVSPSAARLSPSCGTDIPHVFEGCQPTPQPFWRSRNNFSSSTVPAANMRTEHHGDAMRLALQTATMTSTDSVRYNDESNRSDLSNFDHVPELNQAMLNAELEVAGLTTAGHVPAYVVVDPANPENIYLPMQRLSYRDADGPRSIVWGPVVLPIHLLSGSESLRLDNLPSRPTSATEAPLYESSFEKSWSPHNFLASTVVDDHVNMNELSPTMPNRQLALIASPFGLIHHETMPSFDLPLLDLPSSHGNSTSELGQHSAPSIDDSSLWLSGTGYGQGTVKPTKSDSKSPLPSARKKQSRKTQMDSTNNNSGPRILRPLTAYNYFFRDERDNIVTWKAEGLPPPRQDWTDEKRRALLEEHWFVDPVKEKRRHRKTHGKLGFAA